MTGAKVLVFLILIRKTEVCLYLFLVIERFNHKWNSCKGSIKVAENNHFSRNTERRLLLSCPVVCVCPWERFSLISRPKLIMSKEKYFFRSSIFSKYESVIRWSTHFINIIILFCTSTLALSKKLVPIST